jgi:hypothetical protein
MFINEQHCCNPNLGLTTKVRACKGVSQEGNLRVTSRATECEGMNPHTPKELPLWELESWWTPKFSKGDFRGQNPMD